jgi:chloride channel 7
MEVATAADGAPPPPSPPPPPAARPPTPSAESIDYEPPANAHFLAQQAKLARGHRRRSLLGYSGLTATKIAITLAAGFLIGVVAFAVEQAIERGVAARNAWLAPYLTQGVAAGALSHGALALALTLATAGAVEFAAPAAAGAGVSRVLAFLNGNAVADLFTPASFAVRLGGACAARVAGLALGPEAPLVALGGAVASALARLERRAWLPRPGGAADAALAFDNADHREMVAAGVAAGMAAAFGAPLGGALYALEEVSSAAFLSCQSKQKTASQPTNQPTNQPITDRQLPK